MKIKFVVTLFLMISILPLSAQNSYNCVDINLNNTANTACIPCNKHGFSFVKSYLLQDSTKISISLYDTLMQLQIDTSFCIDNHQQIKTANYENDEILILLESKSDKKQFNRKIAIYNIKDKSLSIRQLSNIQPSIEIKNIHHFNNNIIYTISEKRQPDIVYIFPNDESEERTLKQNIPEFYAKVLDSYADAESQNFLICCSSNDKTFTFRIDQHGNYSITNVRNLYSVGAKIFKISNNNFTLICFNQIDDIPTIESAVITDNKMVWNVHYYLRNRRENNNFEQIDTLTSGKVLSALPDYSATTPPEFFQTENRIAIIFDVVKPEYYQYYNGYYYDTRFFCYRYEYAEIMLFDSLGKSYQILTLPYDESHNTHRTLFTQTKTAGLKNENLLLYYMDNEGLTTQLLDKNLTIIDPIRTQEIPLQSKIHKKRNAEIDIFEPWYGNENFVIGAYQYSSDNKNKKVGYIINKLIYK